jgi:hypothetical protein
MIYKKYQYIPLVKRRGSNAIIEFSDNLSMATSYQFGYPFNIYKLTIFILIVQQLYFYNNL